MLPLKMTFTGLWQTYIVAVNGNSVLICTAGSKTLGSVRKRYTTFFEHSLLLYCCSHLYFTMNLLTLVLQYCFPKKQLSASLNLCFMHSCYQLNIAENVLFVSTSANVLILYVYQLNLQIIGSTHSLVNNYELYSLCALQRWVRCFQHVLLHTLASTTNGLERQHEHLKYSYLSNCTRGSLSDLLTAVVRNFVPNCERKSVIPLYA